MDKARAIAEQLQAVGATHCLLVGGYVRDHLLGIESKDLDIEVYGLSYAQIAAALRRHHRVDLVGRSFGVVKVGNEIDISLPRSESKSGVGHTGFAVTVDPKLTPREAAARRDFTINAMAMDFGGKIFDPFGGREDLERGVLRATSAAFGEDPLRVLRGMQFAARFGFDMDQETVEMCRGLRHEFQHLSAERIWEEWHKWATKVRYPSKGLAVLQRTGWTEKFPVLHALAETPQDPVWHPEGDVYTHTGHVCDVAAEIADRERFDLRGRMLLMFGALCHDFGKVVTTVRGESGRWTSPRHDSEGVLLAEQFLAGMMAPGWVVEQVLPLVREHMAHVCYNENESPPQRVVRRLANRLAPSNIMMWSAVVEADASGRPPKPAYNPVARWVSVAESLAVTDERPTAIMMGRHLLPLGYEPGPGMGAILRAAFEAQLDGCFEMVEDGTEWVVANYPVRHQQGLAPKRLK